MTKVCFLVSSLCNEGPVNVMYNIIRYMDFARYEVSIITLVPEKKTTRIDDFKRLPLSIHPLAPDSPLNPWDMLMALRREVNAISPQILHAHCPRSLYLMYFLPGKYKKIYTIHSPGMHQKILYGKLKGTIVCWLNDFFARRMDLSIGCSESVGDFYKKRKGWDIPCIPNGSSLPVWKNDPAYRKQLRQAFGLREDIQYFIFIGRFSGEKNPAMLIDTFKKRGDAPIGLIMLGDGPLWQSLKEKESERILLPGFKTNIYDYLIASDFYISASDVEGLANSLLESMTVGLPMLLSDIPSHREVMSKMTRATGYLFDQKDPESLSENINNLLKIDKAAATQEIHSIFQAYYTAEKMSLSYQNIYQNI